jgi:hypothetical protein
MSDEWQKRKEENDKQVAEYEETKSNLEIRKAEFES